MNCADIAQKIQNQFPDADSVEVARMCLMLFNHDEPYALFADESRIPQVLADARLRLQAATDQHAAVTEELQQLAHGDPREFSPDQIWVLIRAIKIQSQVLKMYHGPSICELS